MTATPIPRTLVLALYGDMAVSELREKPPGRQPIDTRAMPLARLDRILAAVDRALRDGGRLYWVCPLIGAAEDADQAAAEQRYQALAARFGPIVGLVHGRMPAADKDRAMARFAAGAIRLLVATTVIEVGVDVPEATVIVIEQAERFGLAQLHQLRGRVGRGERPSSCLLLYGEPLAPAARARLQVMRATDDGFRTAEEDLRLRGPGCTSPISPPMPTCSRRRATTPASACAAIPASRAPAARPSADSSACLSATRPSPIWGPASARRCGRSTVGSAPARRAGRVPVAAAAPRSPRPAAVRRCRPRSPA
jgi:Helicase conserved C-terminal domain